MPLEAVVQPYLFDITVGHPRIYSSAVAALDQLQKNIICVEIAQLDFEK